MAVTPGFREFVLAQLDELGDVTPKAMFGELGLYHRGVFFAIVAGDQVFLRVDEESRKTYEAEGMRPFSPNGIMSSRRYYAVPLAVLESAAELTGWARRAVAAAQRPEPSRPRVTAHEGTRQRAKKR
jgi:DNA transformation protein